MTTLYLANCTKQNRDFFYRMPEDDPRDPHRTLKIPAGQQRVIPGSFDRVALQMLVDKNLKYGWASLSEVSRRQEFTGVLYSFDTKIPETVITYLIEGNDGKADDLARTERFRAAIAASNAALENGREVFGPDFRVPRAFETYYEEQAMEGLPFDNDKELAAEGVRVELAQVPGPKVTKRSGKRA